MRGLLFVGCMFIGAGLGLVVNRPDVGGAIGMGIGFIAMAFVRVRSGPVQVRVPTSLSGLALVAVGGIFIASGLSLLFDWDLWYPYTAGVLLVAVGLAALLFGVRVMGRR